MFISFSLQGSVWEWVCRTAYFECFVFIVREVLCSSSWSVGHIFQFLHLWSFSVSQGNLWGSVFPQDKITSFCFLCNQFCPATSSTSRIVINVLYVLLRVTCISIYFVLCKCIASFFPCFLKHIFTIASLMST